MSYIFNDIFKDCKKKSFHSLEGSCVYDIKFMIMANNEEVFLSITLGYMKDESQFYGLNLKKSKINERID